MKESSVQQRVRLAIAYAGGDAWRNNVGVLLDINGRPVRYGLANESKEMNEKFKSSDIIGVMPVKITQDMVGKTIGQFIAPECKEEGWTFPQPTNVREYAHCVAQANFHDIVRRAGGKADFVTSEEDIKRLLSAPLS